MSNAAGRRAISVRFESFMTARPPPHQPTFGLASRLAMVLRGEAGDAVLEDFNRGRHLVSSKLLASAGLATRLIKSRRGALFTAFGWLTSFQNALAPLHRRIERRIAQGMSGLGLRYSGKQTEAGLRFPQLPMSDWDGHAARALASTLRKPEMTVVLSEPLKSFDAFHVPGANVVAIQDSALRQRLGATAPQAWVVRPDGYLVARVSNPTVDDLQALLRHTLDRPDAAARAVPAPRTGQ